MGGIYFVIVWTMIKACVASVLYLRDYLANKSQKEGGNENKVPWRARVRKYFKTDIIQFPAELFYENLIFLLFSSMLFFRQRDHNDQEGDKFTAVASAIFGWVCVVSCCFDLGLTALILLSPTRFLLSGLIRNHFGRIYEKINIQRRKNLL